MRELTLLDKLLLGGVFLIVIGLFTLAAVINAQNGLCSIDPIQYAIAHNISINPQNILP